MKIISIGFSTRGHNLDIKIGPRTEYFWRVRSTTELIEAVNLLVKGLPVPPVNFIDRKKSSRSVILLTPVKARINILINNKQISIQEVGKYSCGLCTVHSLDELLHGIMKIAEGCDVDTAFISPLSQDDIKYDETEYFERLAVSLMRHGFKLPLRVADLKKDLKKLSAVLEQFGRLL